LVEDDIGDVADFKFRPRDERDDDGHPDHGGSDAEESDEARIESFESTMDAVKTAVEKLQSQLKHIEDHVESIEMDLEVMEDDQGAMLLNTVKEVQSETRTCHKATDDIVRYFRKAKEFVHPTQNVLITAINQFVEQKVQNDVLSKEIAVLNELLETKDEQIAALKERGPSPVDSNEAERVTQQFVNRIVNQLQDLKATSLSIHNSLKQREVSSEDGRGAAVGDLKTKTSVSYGEIKKMESEVDSLRQTLSQLTSNLLSHEHSVLKVTPWHEYVLALEDRYSRLRQLYRLKLSELEQANDRVIFSECQLETKIDEIEELETRLLRIMTSASTAAETRMEAISTMGVPSQTYHSVMGVIDERLRETTQSLSAIERASKERPSAAKEIAGHCKAVRQGLEAVRQEMSGARNFVHGDREMVESLQHRILEMQRIESLGAISNASTDQKDDDRGGLGDDEESDEEPSPRNKVHFTSSTTMTPSNLQVLGSSQSAFDRRTKSVHEIAWSRFDAQKERGMEELHEKEREVLEQEIRRGIIEDVERRYAERFQREMATARATMQQDLREELRVEYDDLANRLTQSTRDSEEALRARIESTESTLSAEVAALKEGNSALQRDCEAMRTERDSLRRRAEESGSELESARRETAKVRDSKIRLIEATSTEIDSMRQKIKMYAGHRNGL